MHPTRASIAAIIVFLIGWAPLSAADHLVWLEGEAPDRINAEVSLEGWGATERLSGGDWLHAKVEVGKGEELPAGGIVMSYDFTIAEAGTYEVWNRTGFLNVRSPFDWRIDDGRWQTVDPTQVATDLMPIAFWNEVSWLPMGERELTRGAHRLEIRLLDDREGRILYVCDALCLSREPFRPNGKYRPGDESWRSDEDRAAADQVFALPDPVAGERVALALDGRWQYARPQNRCLWTNSSIFARTCRMRGRACWSRSAGPVI